MQRDAFFAHASEDKAFGKELVNALTARGLRVWFNDFIVGPSIRVQMEAGLAQSDFGIVLLSPSFFAKKWTSQELDALFALEGPGDVRILPVWYGVGEDEVRAESPMLVMRSAAVFDGDVDEVADELFKSIVTLSAAKSPARARRVEIASGFEWSRGPEFFPKSLDRYDAEFEQYAFTQLAHFPDVAKNIGSSAPVPLMEVVRSTSLRDGQELTLIGKQPSSTLQVFDEVLREEDLPPDPERPPSASIVAYVFQLTSVEFTNGELCYVHCIGPYDRQAAGWGPRSPDPDWLCWVTGVLLAYGVTPNEKGKHVNVIYVAARSIWFTPPVVDDESTEDQA